MDFKKYKNLLKQYLKLKCFDSTQNPMYCFNPSHLNKNTPACMIYEDNFKCASCGIQGDIYDACEILTGIKEKAEQYKEVEKILKGYNIEPKKKKEKFQPDIEALKKLIEYMRNHAGKLKGVMAFLKTRGYSEIVSKKMYGNFGYWPGYEIALEKIEKDILKKAGIPLIHPKHRVSSWDHSGVVVKLAKGLKLCYYNNDICEKRGSRSCFTFPSPGKLPEKGKIILVEAEISSISMRAVGFVNVFATGGTNALTIKVIKEKLLSMEEIILAFDGDTGGRKASGIIKIEKGDKEKCYPDILFREGYKGIVKIAHLPDEKDPDDFIQKNKIEELKKIINDSEIYKNPYNKKKVYTPIKKHKNDVPFIFMGFDNRSYYVIPDNQNIPLKINRGEQTLKNWLKEIAPFEWWYKEFQKTDKDDNISFDLAGALAWFRKTSISKGIYNDDNIRGLGIHEDGDDIVFNTGEKLHVNDEIFSYNDYIGKYVYCRSKIKLEISGNEWTIKEGIEFIKQLKTFHFERMIDYMVIPGFTAIAYVSSILDRRPSIWLTGQSGCGKTHLIKNVIEKGVGKKQTIYTEGGATEAYIRQKTGRDCRIPIIDEFEAHNKSEKYELKKIMKLLRSCYGGINMGKGTPDHKPIDFNTKIMFCLASVNVFFDSEAARNRIAICRLRKKPIEDKNYFNFKHDFNGMRMRIYNRIKKLNQNIKKAKEIILKAGYDNRTGDTYAPFITGFWLLISDNDFFEGDDKIQKYILKAIEEIKLTTHRSDEERIIDRILQERIKIDPSNELTISEMLTEKFIDMEGNKSLKYDKLLQRYGIRRYTHKKVESIAIDRDHPAVKHILKDTPFTDYKEVLQRHDAMLHKSDTAYMAGYNTRCIILDWASIYEEYFKEIDDIPF